MNIYERIKKIADQKGIAISKIEKSCGFSNATIKKWKTSQPAADRLQQVSTYLQVDSNYLLGRNDTPHPSNEIPPNGFVMMHVIGSISAGYDGEAIEELLDDYPVTCKAFHGYSPEDCFVLRVKGESMFPNFHEGDYVLVHRQPSVDSGDIAVIMHNDAEATLKKVLYNYGEDWLELIPNNPQYPTKRIEGTELQSCRVLGKVLTIIYRENL